MNSKIPAKIRRMSRRRQKVVLKSWIQKDFDQFVGLPNSRFVHGRVTKVLITKLGLHIHADVHVQYDRPVERIDFSVVVSNTVQTCLESIAQRT